MTVFTLSYLRAWLVVERASEGRDEGEIWLSNKTFQIPESVLQMLSFQPLV